MLYMIIERFRNGDPKPIYERFEEKGRLAPDGLEYISSWVNASLDTCFQLMETDDEKLIDEWIKNWEDLADFEIYPVVNSAEASALVLQRQ
ncbi:MAG: DUF3303 family protein [Acidobacteria bacterium]|nr:DUF3303 family protein [Acidobacteriota bacterium]